MKDTVKFFSVVTGIFRSLVTILFLLGIGFTVLVDSSLLISFLDLLGFDGVSTSFVKPILILLFALLFIVNFIITRNIYKAGNTGDYHLSNFVFGLLFLALTTFFYITFRNLTTNLIFVIFALNVILVLNSLLGLVARARGLYSNKAEASENLEKPSKYIEFVDDDVEKKSIKDTNKINVTADKKERSEEKDKPKEKEHKVIEKDQKLVFESKDNKKATSSSKTQDIDDRKVYGDEEAEKIRKEKDEKVFDKSQFTKIKIDDINKDKN